MTERPSSALVTILFTDLVGSTEFLSRAGDEDAQRIFRAHHTLLAETAATHGGAEVKWLGDGLMAAFTSAADALRCAIAMQQASRLPVAGERLAIRVGLNAGEAFRDETDYFGTPVVVARRLCDQAASGQILCSELVAGLLAGRARFGFSPLGALDLKGVPKPVEALEVTYESEPTAGFIARLPFVGRDGELARLLGLLAEAVAGRGGLAFVIGEPGIGKTRLTEELVEAARREGAEVLWGHCVDGDWAPPYAPFVEVVEALAATAEPEDLRVDLGMGGPVLAPLVNALTERFPDLPPAAPLQPDEERFRLLDAMAQLLIARSRRHPVLVCLDDLHWADGSTVAMLRHVVRFAPGHRLLVIGTYRDAEVGADHPLQEALGALRREVEFERLKLEGLEAKAVGELLEALADYDVVGSVAAAIAAETDGNPFFIKEVLRHLVEDGRFVRGADGRWTSDRPVTELGIPEGVREVIDRRIGRLSADARKLLSAASVFEDEIHLGVAAAVAGLDEEAALDALDEALDSQLLQPAGTVDAYRFTHALIRHTLAGELSPSRRARLHLRAAEALAAASPEPAPARSGEIASQYHRAAGLPGAERGVEPALAAADHAQGSGGHDEAVRFLRIALELLPEDDARRTGLLSRLAIVLCWALEFEEAVAVATEAAGAMAGTGDKAAAARYLSEAAYVCAMAGGVVHSWKFAAAGLSYAEDRDVAWARLVSFDAERRAAEDPAHPGIPHDSPERRESARILRAARLDPLGPAPMESVFDTRAEALESANLVVRTFCAGEYKRCLAGFEAEAAEAESQGRLARAARGWAMASQCHTAQGRLTEGQAVLARAEALGARIGVPILPVLSARVCLATALDEEWEAMAEAFAPLAHSTHPALAFGLGWARAVAARAEAGRGRTAEALAHLAEAVPWLLQRLDHAPAIETALREKIVGPDFRFPLVDGRLSLGRLCALTGRHDEAGHWFGEARRVLDDEGGRPLRACTDYEEALMYVRRDQPGDGDRARPLLDAAHRQFEAIGMTGWIRRAEELDRSLS
jgi:class 3 adenylate cyclase/tetratricopeptide (TPR) repeat protein